MWITDKRLKKLRDILVSFKPQKEESESEFRARLQKLAEQFRLSLNSITDNDIEGDNNKKEFKKIIFKATALEKILNINILT